MQKKKILNITLEILLILLLFFNNLVFSEEQNINSYEYIKLEIINNINFDVKIENEYKISNFDVYSYFFPTTYNNSQYLNSFETTHNQYQVLNDSNTLYLNFKYDENTLTNKNKIQNKFIVESIVYRPELKNKIEYPIINISEENKQYLQFSGLIDYDENIKTQASNLAKGETDVFIIASKTAKWIIEDINYNLSSVIANPNQKSTDVFKSKSGVCKEITNLYVSMMRSVGIPARVVTGYAYTNSEEIATYVGSNWGGHAWAEVLIGDTWVPFDLTYNQYGYVDASHIILDKTKDSRNRGYSINATGHGISLLQNNKENNEFRVLDKKEKIFKEGFDIKIEGPQEIGFDSYGYLKITAINQDDFYKILFLKIANPSEIELLDNSEKMIIFMPNEKKEIYFRYKLPILDSNYIYTLPFLIYNEFYTQQFNVTSSKDFMKIKQIALPKEENKTIIYSNNKLIFDCNFILEAPKNLIFCSVKNPNNYEINNLNICITTSCERIDLKLNEVKSISFNTLNYIEKVSYIYEKENGEFELNVDIPKLIYNYNQMENNLYLNFSILNHTKGFILNIYLNDVLIKNSILEKENILIYLNEGNNTIKSELLIKDKLLEDNNFTVFYKKEKFIESPIKTTQSWFSKLWDWIIHLI